MKLVIFAFLILCHWRSFLVAFPFNEEQSGSIQMSQNDYPIPSELSQIRFEIVEAFLSFKKKFNKVYASTEEELKRFWKFIVNYGKIINYNSFKNKSFDLELNRFADMDLEEIRQLMNGLDAPHTFQNHSIMNTTMSSILSKIDLPMSKDWRALGAVTQVKDQGDCGSCYAFSATGALEAQYFLKFKHLMPFSEQQLVSCNPLTHGCHGGLPSKCFEYVKAKGILTESDYPYTATVDKCKFNQPLRQLMSVLRVSSFINLARDEEVIKAAVALVGPVSIGINSRCHSFIFYKSGIYNDLCCSSKRINHAVLVVGYGVSEKKKPFWIIKNSWGSDWGDGGYVRIARGINLCGITTIPSIPLV